MKQYETYKDSGVEWIGEIPEHWEVNRLKNLVSEPLKYGANESADESNPNNPRYIRITDFGNDGNLRNDTFKSLPLNKANSFLLNDGDLLFARSGATVGKTFLFKNYKGSACFAGYLIKATFNKSNINSTYVDYFTRSNYYENWKQSVFQQATIQNIGADKYNQLRISIPNNVSEQTHIANYLNKKTAQLDTLIAKKEQLISLLQEERTAMINHAVTKGLDPNVPMKDSGIEWLGEIPAHWEVKKLKYVCQLVSDKTKEKPDYVLALENITSWSEEIIGNPFENKMEGDSNLFQENDILFNKLRPYLAKVVKATRNGGCVGELLVLRPEKKICPNFLYRRLSSEMIITIVDGSTYGTKMPRASWDKFISNIQIGVPPREKQEQISDYIETKLNYSKSIVEKYQKEIELLKEYKTALISEVVTGKVDVREEVLN